MTMEEHVERVRANSRGERRRIRRSSFALGWAVMCLAAHGRWYVACRLDGSARLGRAGDPEEEQEQIRAESATRLTRRAKTAVLECDSELMRSGRLQEVVREWPTCRRERFGGTTA